MGSRAKLGTKEGGNVIKALGRNGAKRNEGRGLIDLRVRVSARNHDFAAREFWFSFTLPCLGHRRGFRRSTWMRVWCVKTKMVNQKVIDSEGLAAKVNLVNQNR